MFIIKKKIKYFWVKSEKYVKNIFNNNLKYLIFSYNLKPFRNIKLLDGFSFIKKVNKKIEIKKIINFFVFHNIKFSKMLKLYSFTKLIKFGKIFNYKKKKRNFFLRKLINGSILTYKLSRVKFLIYNLFALYRSLSKKTFKYSSLNIKLKNLILYYFHNKLLSLSNWL